MDLMHDTTDRMHANPMLVNRHHGGSYPASDLTWCISHDAIATRALATMPSSHPAASPRFHADSHVRRDCRQACRPDVHTSLSLTDRKQVQLQLSACHHAYSRVNLMYHARAVWAVPQRGATVSLSAASLLLACSCLGLEHHSICAST
jgi:hypothetical protein